MITVNLTGVVLLYLAACSITFLCGCLAGMAIIRFIRRKRDENTYETRYRQGLNRQY